MKTTPLVTFIMLLTLSLYDLAAVLIGGTQSSVSQWLADTTHASPLQAFVCGALCCHFFGWMMVPTKRD